MLAYGASFDLTPKEKGMRGAIERAAELQETIENAWIPSQFDNQANVEIIKTQRLERYTTISMPPPQIIITGVGTGGHITGVAEELKRLVKFVGLRCRADTFTRYKWRSTRTSSNTGNWSWIHPWKFAYEVHRWCDTSPSRRCERNGALSRKN